jgi:L-ascorbate metabolism protein UlaG (beta-lactamase superfamily)
MKVTYYGHSSFMVETAGKSILFDPFISPNPLAKGIDVAAIRPDYMMLSHGHNDHTADAPAIARQSGCTVIGIWEMASWMENQGAAKVHPMNIGGSWNFEFGTVKLTQAVHSSSLADGSPAGNPTGFVISNADDTFYYSGDTALYSDMTLISKKFTLKTAFLPIGSNFTMDAEDAVEAAKLLRVKHVIGMHYDTFGYIEIDHNKTRALFNRAGIELVLMNINTTINL